MGQSSSDPELFFVKKQKVNWEKKMQFALILQ